MSIAITSTNTSAGNTATATQYNSVVTDLTALASVINGLWLPADAITFVSTDGNMAIANVASDVTAIYYPGMRIKYTQDATTKYGIVHAVGVFALGVTPLTIWGGTDYTMNGNAITNVYYAFPKTYPIGFPMNPDKWSVVTLDTTIRTTIAPTTGVYYNTGSLNIVIPIGLWRTFFEVAAEANGTNVVYGDTMVALSTSASSVTDTNLKARLWGYSFVGGQVSKETVLSLAVKTTYYLIHSSTFGTGSTAEMRFRNSDSPAKMKAISLYL